MIILVTLPWIALTAQTRSYTVSFLGLIVVDVGITVAETEEEMSVSYVARSRPWFQPFYSADNRYQITTLQETKIPVRYDKLTIEGDFVDSLTALYNAQTGIISYSNGLTREWLQGEHNHFSGLVWLEQRTWQLGERKSMSVEVEGVTWQVEIHCYKIDVVEESHQAQLKVTFIDKIRGTPVLDPTDRVTQIVPGKGHELRLNLDQDEKKILWIEIGRRPFVVKALIEQS